MRWTPRDGLLLIAGLGFVLAVWALKGCLFPAEWEKEQRIHSALRQSFGLSPVRFGIRTIKPEGAAEERCPTCHLEKVQDAREKPAFRPHLETGCRQPIAAQGCTVCHRGIGAALSSTEAHGRSAVARAGLLDYGDAASRRDRMQAGCAGCHLRRDQGVLRYDAHVVPQVAQGLHAYLANGCAACHQLSGVFATGDTGPALDGIALRMDRFALGSMVRRPQEQRPGSVMPGLSMDNPDIEPLLTFLQAQVGLQRERACGPACVASGRGANPSLASHFEGELPERANPAAGALWARRAGCPGCHGTSANERGVPDLSRVGWFRSELHFRQVLSEPRRWCPETLMPAMRLPEVVTESVVAWLSMQRRTIPSRPQDVLRDVCFRCHGREPEPRSVLSRKPPRLEGRKAEVTRERFVQVATEGVDHTPMAPWGRILTPSFLGAMHDALD